MWDFDDLDEQEEKAKEAPPPKAAPKADGGETKGQSGAEIGIDFDALDIQEKAHTNGIAEAPNLKPWCMVEDDLKHLPIHRVVERPKRFVPDVVNKVVPGEFWGIEFPFSPNMLKEWGPSWLTQAMHRAGTLPPENEVTKFVQFDVKAADTSKEDAENAKWGGAAIKILLTVEYRQEQGAPTTKLFVKVPHPLGPGSERAKNSGAMSGDWPETIWYNLFGGRYGDLPIQTPRCLFSDMARSTTNFIHIIERLPLGTEGFNNVEIGKCYPPPEKYRDWSLPGQGVDLYYAHVRTLARFFGWYAKLRKTTDVVDNIFFDPASVQFWKKKQDEVEAAGKYNSASRDQFLAKALQSDPEAQAAMQTLAAAPAAYLSFLDLGVQFIELTKHVFPTDLVTRDHLKKLFSEAREIQMYHKEMKYHMRVLPEFCAIEHPNAQVDNAWYWKLEDGGTDCGLLDWGGVFPGSIPNCIGNGWIGAEPDLMDEHEGKLLQCFVDEFKKETGVALDVDDLWMHVKLAQAMVLPGCCVNTQRIRGTIDWKKVKSRKDPAVNDNFLGRCYFVQIELFLAMWRRRSPYAAFTKWRKRLGLPLRAAPAS